MFIRIFLWVKQQYARLSYPCILLILLLQRSPLIRWVADVHSSLVPRTYQLWTIVTGAVTLGAYNSVTAASGEVLIKEGSNTTTMDLGSQLRLIFEVEGKGNEPKSWGIKGSLPPGVVKTELISLRVMILGGFPNQPGTYGFEVIGYHKANQSGDATPPFPIRVIVEQAGPVIIQQPIDQSVGWGGDSEFTVALEDQEGAIYQWEKQSAAEPAEFDPIEGETASVLSLALVTSSDDANYRAAVTSQGETIFSDSVHLTVNASPFQRWREAHFEDPFSAQTGLDQDPDLDTQINAIEFAFGMDPHVMEKSAFVRNSVEILDGVTYGVYTFPPLAEGIDSVVSVESNSLPGDAGWEVLVDGVNGVIIESTAEWYVVKIPAENRSFARLRVVANEL
jgi:hypothetical protein